MSCAAKCQTWASWKKRGHADSRMTQRCPSQPSTPFAARSRSFGTGGRHQLERVVAIKLEQVVVINRCAQANHTHRPAALGMPAMLVRAPPVRQSSICCVLRFDAAIEPIPCV
jgi:hypothetical protein